MSEEQSDEFQVFPEMRRQVEAIQSGYAATEGNCPEVFLDLVQEILLLYEKLFCRDNKPNLDEEI